MVETLSPAESGASRASRIVCTSRDLASISPEAVVCVPTFRRPAMLRRTLQSLVRQQGVACFAVVIVDNDSESSAGAPVAASFLIEGQLSGLCIVEERQGNCHAINRAFREARDGFPTARYFLMIDDDEIADPTWLERMIAAARDHDADIVGGPVVPEFPVDSPPALPHHPVYWPAWDKSGPVPMIYGSGNCLITRRAFGKIDDPNFNLRYNYLGGGDTDFFSRCRAAGLVFYWEQTARIVETVPLERLRAEWIWRRGLRIGAINFRIDSNTSRTPFARARLIAKNLALLPVALGRSLRFAMRGEPALVALHPLAIAIGRWLAWLGLEPEQYRVKAAGPK
jgi:glycosyltransferase involved in cell wall biosynthesis